MSLAVTTLLVTQDMVVNASFLMLFSFATLRVFM